MKRLFTDTEVKELLRRQREICADRAVIDYAEPDKLALLTMAPEPKDWDFIKENEPKFNPKDYVILNPVGELSYLRDNEIAVGVRNFLLSGQPCLMEYEYEGKKYKRTTSGVIPRGLTGELCSVQIYELVK